MGTFAAGSTLAEAGIQTHFQMQLRSARCTSPRTGGGAEWGLLFGNTHNLLCGRRAILKSRYGSTKQTGVREISMKRSASDSKRMPLRPSNMATKQSGQCAIGVRL